jgi:hypothetical protein
MNVDTRWNSIHDMLESVLINFHKCEDLLLERNESIYIDHINLKSVADFVQFLSIFKMASEQLSADQTPTMHLVIPWFSKLKRACEVEENDSLLLVQFKNAVNATLDEKVHLAPLHYIATFLHPATKRFAVSVIKCINQTLSLSCFDPIDIE